MNKIVKAPFSDKQVSALDERQRNPTLHPYTCDKSSPECVTKHFTGADGKLIATKEGWVCPCNEYTQDWAHEKDANQPT